jgi:uncharacterized repeat protein (TIGR03803 family)
MKCRILSSGYVFLFVVAAIFGLHPFAASQDAATVSEHAQYKVLYAFQGQNAPNGSVPNAYVIPDAAGNLYGTATSYGADDDGAVFKLNATGLEYTVVHAFEGYPDDGSNPTAGLLLDAASGRLYGTTVSGGSENGAGNWGTVFQVDAATGVETVLHSFDSSDGAFPGAALVRDAAGNLYGTTIGCAALDIQCHDFYGEVFKLDTTGKLTILHHFTSEAAGGDGAIPESGLVQDAAGNLYGTTLGGGAASHGTVFKIDAKGKHTILHSFTGGRDGKWPQFGNLILDAAGNLYGATNNGGAANLGVVFKLSLAGKFTTLYTFKGGKDGENPSMPLARDTAGNLYGTSREGGDGSCACGTIFKVDTSGNKTVLHNFISSVDGAYPTDGLIEDASGNLYGTTTEGGNPNVACRSETTGCGTVFKFKP